MAPAAKRAGRETTEGLVGYRIEDGDGTIVAVGCETEPVSKNEEFLAFAKKRARGVHADGPDAVAVARGGARRASSPSWARTSSSSAPSATSGEGEVVIAYVHPPANKIGVLVKLGAAARSWRGSSRCTSRSRRPSG